MTTVFAPAPLPPRPAPPARRTPAAHRAAVARGAQAAHAVAVPQRRPARQLEPAPRPHLRVVQPGERTMRRLTPLGGIVLTALVFLVLAGLAGAHTLIAQGQMRLDSLDDKVQTEQARYQALRKQVAEAESPDRIVEAAEAQGMVSPDDLVYLQPPTDEGQRDPGTADDADRGSGADETASSWSTVKPLLEVPTP
jgi:cell division protein FtsL